MSGKGTAKGRADIKSSDEKNNVEAMTADELLASQEFPPQNKLTKRVIAFSFDYDLPIKATEEFISIIENIREQAREEMASKINEFIEKRTVSESPTWLTLKIDIATFVNNLLGEGKRNGKKGNGRML